MHLSNVRVTLGSREGGDTPGSVVIGLGDPNPENSKHRVILNHKGYRGPQFASVSEFVASASDRMWSTWKNRIATSAQIKTLVIEDYSFDTCFAWLLFMARLEEKPVCDVTDLDEVAWIDYVTAWEGGRFVDPAPETSPACLMTALAHAVWPRPGAEAETGLASCLQFLQEIVNRCPKPPPAGLPSDFSTELQRRSVAQIGFDRQQYDAALERGKSFQLLLPISIEGPEASHLLIVDALALEEAEPTGILKIIARTDRDNAWTKRGFSVLAIHRPSQVGTGNDMTVSVDPAKRLILKDLWQRLEEMEDERWGTDRPRDHPRHLKSYSLEGEVTPGAPNEPWYDEEGRYTLIGAPRGDGTRLDWHADVLPELWELYFLRHVRDRVTFGPPRDSSGKHIHLATWKPSDTAGSDSYRLLPDAPSFHAWLAACSMREHHRDVRSPGQLPNPGAFERVPLDGGYAIVTRDGVALFYEAPTDATSDLLELAQRLAEAIKSYSDFIEGYSVRFEGWLKQLQRSDGQSAEQVRDVEAWERDITAARTQVLEADTYLVTLPQGFDAERLRASLARLWGLSERRDEVQKLIDRLDQLMRLSIARRTERRERIYGSLLSAAGLAIVAGRLWETIADSLPLSTFQQHLSVALANLVGFCLGLGLFWLLGIRSGSKS